MLNSFIAFCLSRRAIVVFGLLAFAAAGFFAYKQLNIEAYPNPTPVILEITAQAPGLSAEEMERYYTRPIEIGLYTTPGIEIIRSTSFYGLSFVRVTFKYGVDFDFAYGQAAIALQQNVSLPGGQVPNGTFELAARPAGQFARRTRRAKARCPAGRRKPAFCQCLGRCRHC